MVGEVCFFCFKRGTPSEHDVLRNFMHLQWISLLFAISPLQFFQHTKTKQKRKRNQKKTIAHPREGGELGPSMLFFLFSCLFVYFCFSCFLFFGFLVSCLYFLKRSQEQHKSGGPKPSHLGVANLFLVVLLFAWGLWFLLKT